MIPAPNLRFAVNNILIECRHKMIDWGEEDVIENIEMSIDTADFMGHFLFASIDILHWFPVEIVIWICVEYFKVLKEEDALDVEWLAEDAITVSILSFFSDSRINSMLNKVTNSDYRRGIDYCIQQLNYLFPKRDGTILERSIIEDGLNQDTKERFIQELKVLAGKAQDATENSKSQG